MLCELDSFNAAVITKITKDISSKKLHYKDKLGNTSGSKFIAS